MAVLYILIPLAIILASASALAFYWASSTGQFDDVDSPAIRMLFEEKTVSENPKSDQ